MIDLVAGPIKIVSIPALELKKMLFYHRTFDDWMRLRKENESLKARLVGHEEVVKENVRLERLLSFKRETVYSSVAASVIGRDPSRWSSSIVIDRGEEDGLKQGFAVVSALGVVGKIAEVGPRTSKVILLVDPQFSVAGLVQRPRESGLVSGTLQGLCRIRYLNEDADIQVGDKVITSKLSSSFPEGLIVGEIIDVSRSSKNESIEGLIQPAVSFSQMEEVLIIMK